MNTFDKVVHRIDSLQQRHSLTAFVVAVFKKYGDDQASYQAALLTYFGFLSLFPLLLVLTTLLQMILRGHPHLQAQIIESTTSYFPIIGDQLRRSIHGFGKTGLALVVGILITLYGAKGVADVFRQTVNHIWHVPIIERSNFWDSLRKSFSIMVVGGIGFILAALVAGYATSAGQAHLLRLILTVFNLVILFGVMLFIIKVALAKNRPYRELWVGALGAAVSIVVLQGIGGYIVTHQLKHLDSLYGTFALVLGLLFWLYLQSQIVVRVIEIDPVRVLKLWPRSLVGPEPKPDGHQNKNST